ncbi:hypothetical protein HDU98_002139 [Podochytrium sp. JEL0797]|nr:hypothetical protein HDU98_002139 [Podochytrium sp. JEL0797]
MIHASKKSLLIVLSLTVLAAFLILSFSDIPSFSNTGDTNKVCYLSIQYPLIASNSMPTFEPPQESPPPSPLKPTTTPLSTTSPSFSSPPLPATPALTTNPTCTHLPNSTLRPPTSTRPKLIDIFVYHSLSSLDALEIRIHTLDLYVDLFVILEPEVPFNVTAVELESDVWATLGMGNSSWGTKIQRVRVPALLGSTAITATTTATATAEETLEEYEMGYETRGLEIVQGQFVDGDVVLVGKVEEIPRPEVARALKECEGYAGVMSLEMDVFTYGYEYRNYGVVKTSARVVTWPSGSVAEVGGVVEKAGWACRLCVKDLEQAEKLVGGGGVTSENLLRMFRFGLARPGSFSPVLVYEPVRMDTLPDWMQLNRERYSHLVDRRNAWAGFQDVKQKHAIERNAQVTACAHAQGVTMESDDLVNRRVIDYFLYNGEVDVLEIRLNTLDAVVDVFILAETSVTFSGHPKPLQFPAIQANPDFHRFLPKIVHIVMDLPQNVLSSSNHFDREQYIRDQGLIRGLEKVVPVAGDLVITGDLDEIPRPGVVAGLRTCSWDSGVLLTLQLDFYYYGFEYRHVFEHWTLAKMYPWYPEMNYTATQMREAGGTNMTNVQVNGAGWHCSWCFQQVSSVLSKVQAYSHADHNEPEYLTKKNIVNAFRWGFDIFGRTLDKFIYQESTVDVPDWIAQNRERFAYVLDRRNVWGGFEDVKVEFLETGTVLLN